MNCEITKNNDDWDMKISTDEIEIHPLTAEDIKKFSEDLQRVPERSEEAQEVFDTLFNYFSHMIVRCKDCKYRRKGLPYCAYFGETDFCSKGKRRDTNECK